MKAETAFNVFDALTDVEKQRLIKMLPGVSQQKEKIILKKSIITDSQARDIIRAHFLKFSKRIKSKSNEKN